MVDYNHFQDAVNTQPVAKMRFLRKLTTDARKHSSQKQLI